MTQAEGSGLTRTPTSAPLVTSAGPTRPTVSYARWCRGRGPRGPRVVRCEDASSCAAQRSQCGRYVSPSRASPRRHRSIGSASTNTHTAAYGPGGPDAGAAAVDHEEVGRLEDDRRAPAASPPSPSGRMPLGGLARSARGRGWRGSQTTHRARPTPGRGDPCGRGPRCRRTSGRPRRRSQASSCPLRSVRRSRRRSCRRSAAAVQGQLDHRLDMHGVGGFRDLVPHERDPTRDLRWPRDQPQHRRHRRVIACLDVDAGRVVKGVNFANLRDAGDPVELAKLYDSQGVDELTFLDVTASSGNRETTYEVVRRTAEQVFIPLTVGGGVRTVDDVDRLLRAGADKVGVNTAAIARPELISEIADRFGAQVLVLSADVRRRSDDVRSPDGGLRHDDPRRAHARRPRRRRVVRPGRRARRRRDPAQLDGRGRDEGRLRPRADPPSAPGRRRCRSSPAAVPAGSSTSPRRSRPGPTPCSPRASSTSASSRSARSGRPCGRAGVIVR